MDRATSASWSILISNIQRTGSHSGMKVLIADDEPLARERLARQVSALAGYTALPDMAANGHEVLDLVEKLHPDIVLLDIRMPGMDGLQAAARLCELPDSPAVVVCTAHGEYALEAFAVSPVRHLSKLGTRE